MSRKKTNSIIIKVVAAVVLLALLGAGIAFIYRYTNGLNEDFKTFYLEYNGEKILQGKTERSFTQGTEVKFNVRYTFDLGDEPRDYSVKVYPNSEESFEYYVDDLALRWRAGSETEDLSGYFGLKKEAESFSLTIPADMTIETLLGSVYRGQNVSVADAEALSEKLLYTLEISSYNGKFIYTVNFSVRALTVELDKDHIIFYGD